MGEPKIEPQREDVLTTTSNKSGVAGFIETALRRFRTFAVLVLLVPLIFLMTFTVGLALGPALFAFNYISDTTLHLHPILHYFAIGWGFAISIVIYGVGIIFAVPAVNFILPFRPKPFRGPWYSIGAIPWFYHNALTYMARYTFLEFVTPTPLNILFYKMMGMRIGKGVVINTTNISDPCLITIGDYVTIGGSATIFAHYGQRGYLIIAPTIIGKGTNVGLKASIMGGVTVGENVTIKPHAALLPKTTVPDGSVI